MVFFYNIEDEKTQLDILNYIYRNKKFIKICESNNFMVKSVSENRIKVCKTFIGIGKYVFVFNNERIGIEYREEGDPVQSTSCGGVEYYKRLIMSSDSEDILKNFLIHIKKDKESNNIENNKLTIYSTSEYGDWFTKDRLYFGGGALFGHASNG
jgi:hypothetical protein